MPKRKLLLLGLGLTVILFLSAQEKQKQETKYRPYYYQKKTLFEKLPDTSDEIIFLGDSITDGCNWSELFQDIRIKNRGISGDVTDGILARLKEVTASRPAKLFLMIGINDLAAGKKVNDVVDNIHKIIKKIRRTSEKTDIYIQSLLPVNQDFGMFKNHTDKTEEILEINQKLKILAEKYTLFYIDLHSAFSGEDNKLKPRLTNDGLHLTGTAYLLWKSMLEKYLK